MPIALGHSPITHHISFQAVMTVTPKKIEHQSGHEPEPFDGFKPHLELWYAGMAATASMTPHWLIGY